MEIHKNEQQLDVFAKKYLKELPLESPSKDFTKNILDVISKEEVVITKYAPLISWKSWVLVAASILAFFFIPFKESESTLFDQFQIDFSFGYLLDKIPAIEGIAVSSVTFYAVIFFGFMISIQTFFLKNYFSKKYQF